MLTLKAERSIKISNMNDYLVDRETLGQFADALITQKYQNQPVAESFREDLIREIDDKISAAIFSSLSTDKLNEINTIFDRNEDDPRVFQEFFQNSGIDLQQIIANVMNSFKTNFLGGKNA